MSRYAQLAYTRSVQQQQAQRGSARANTARLIGGTDPDRLGRCEREFIAQRDGFYLATVNQFGWPYVQFRGGPPGFLHVLDDRTLAFVDVRGNRQYITTGNLDADNRVALFFMDYACQRRLKLFGYASHHALDEDPSLADRLNDTCTDGHVERIVVIRVEGLDWNCTQHITPRFTVRELAPVIDALKEQITALEQENARLRRRCEATEVRLPRTPT
jgi:predicted pyridoxine 5'-phosphate oxidase superfamily flavin-nucleotide-binding protein